uniref:Uncharacterized protein n=1 Tax=Tanacetum cinerariifolium TaxID=118510 RepID=A0A699I112_TANCI|nr:hypothetical protein [Tanacetum cinerariifolium]
MTSFGYRLNLRYAIKECLSCGALYTGDFCCSTGNVEDNILFPKLLTNCARCAKCGHPVNGPYCQGCTLLREKLEEDLVTYFQNFQNTSESSDDSTYVVNAPREPVNSSNDSPSIFANSSQNPPYIDKCCCECGEALDGIFCQQCKCKSCGKVIPSEPVDSLSIGDEHFDTIPATESDEFIKSCVENLVPNPSESAGENGCDLPACFTTFSNFLFDADYDFESVDDQSLHSEDVSEKIFSNTLFEEEIISIKIDQHHINAESDLVESMLNRDSSVISSSSKIDSLLIEFVEFFFLPVTSPVLLSSGSEDKIFDPGITINRVYSFKPGLSHRCRAFKKFNTYRSHLNEWPMIINGKNITILDVLLFHFYPL